MSDSSLSMFDSFPPYLMVAFFWNFQITWPHSQAPPLQNVNMAMSAWSHVSTINSREAVRVCVWAYLRLKTVQRKQNFGAIYCMYIARQWGVNTVHMKCRTYSCSIHIIHCFFLFQPFANYTCIYMHHVRDTRLSLHCCGARVPENEAKISSKQYNFEPENHQTLARRNNL